MIGLQAVVDGSPRRRIDVGVGVPAELGLLLHDDDALAERPQVHGGVDAAGAAADHGDVTRDDIDASVGLGVELIRGPGTGCGGRDGGGRQEPDQEGDDRRLHDWQLEIKRADGSSP